MTAPRWSALDRARIEVGDLLDRHERGLSFEELEAYRGRFAEFCSDLFGITLTPQQTDGAEALDHHRQVLIVGGNGVGKDTLTALRAMFEVYVHRSLALLSGPTDRQVREVLLRREIGRLWRRAEGKLPGDRYEMAIRIPGRERTGLLAFTATSPDLWQGHHADRLFIGITEGSAVAADIFEAAQGCMVGPGSMLVVTNPTTPDCAPYAFSRSGAWRTLYWSVLDHPNIVEGREIIRGGPTREWLNAVEREHGRGSRFWRVRVEAQWPEESESALLEARWIDAAVERWDRCDLEGRARREPLVVGLDVARLGRHRSVAALRQGGVVRRFEVWRKLDTVALSRVVLNLVRGSRTPVRKVVVDEAGVGGGTLDILKETLPSHHQTDVRPDGRRVRAAPCEAVGFLAGSRADDPTRYRNRRAEVAWGLRGLLEAGEIALPPEPKELRDELLRMVVVFSGDGRLEVPKSAMSGVGSDASPDLADALMLAVVPMVEPRYEVQPFHWM